MTFKQAERDLIADAHTKGKFELLLNFQRIRKCMCKPQGLFIRLSSKAAFTNVISPSFASGLPNQSNAFITEKVWGKSNPCRGLVTSLSSRFTMFFA